MAKKKKAATNKDLSFEDALEELEAVVDDLEAGNLPLTDSIQRYEAGVKLLKQCHDSLNHVRRKIELLTEVDGEGDSETVPFDDAETSGDRPTRGKTDLGPEMDDEGRLF